MVIHEGKIGSLRRFKDDVRRSKSGLECGIGFERFNDVKVGDAIEVFVVERVAATVCVNAECRNAECTERSDFRTLHFAFALTK